jgi:hypothetical protein
MPEFSFFDANAQLGRYNFRVEGGPYSLSALLEDMQARGIGRRLVYHALSREDSAPLGNERLMHELVGHAELVPCWAVSTWVTGEMPPPADFIAQLRDNQVRAVRFFRHAYTVSPAEWAMGPLWSALEQAQVPGSGRALGNHGSLQF